ncbi:bcl-2-binding component 3 isoform X2 [Stigmatopora nigra]
MQDQRQGPEAADRRGPLPPGDRSLPGGGATLESRPIDTTIVAHQLRAIGDDFNAGVLRAHEAPHLQDWIEAGRGVLNLAARTLSALYRLA